MKKVYAPLILLCLAVLLPATAHALCVNIPEANLRAGPGSQYQKTWEVLEYMPLKKVGQQGAWYEVEDVDGDRHWIHGRMVTESMTCAVVTVKEAPWPPAGYRLVWFWNTTLHPCLARK